MKSITYSRPHLKNDIQVEFQSNLITAISGAQNLKIDFNIDNDIAYISLKETDTDLFIACLEALFTNTDILSAKITTQNSLRIDLDEMKQDNLLTLTRTQFFQLPNIWTKNLSYLKKPIEWTVTKDVTHPIRPQVAEGEVLYKRFVPLINKTVTFRCIDIEKDLDTFHTWHNRPRIAYFWELNQQKEELRTYLERGLRDPHSIPSIVELDGQAIGYFEFYWVKEDRLGPYYESGMFDRGFHLLIGEAKAMGFDNTDSILKSTCHYIYLDEVQTRTISCEPRSDNYKIIRYVETFPAWTNVKEFDFPHKRAALLQCTREKFFIGRYL